MSWNNESRVDMNVYSQGEVDKWVYNTCNICSIGCGCFIAVKDNKIVCIKGNADHPINRGRLGPKGENQWFANNSPDRLLTPLIRKNGTLVPASWDEAFNLLVSKVQETLDSLGPNGIAIYSTGQATLETYYTIAKIGRAGLRSHLLDANTRLCTATTQWALLESFGADGVPASMDDVDLTDTLMLFGHNVAETGTVLFERIMKRKKETGLPYIIVVDVRETLTAKEADLFLQLNPGTNLALLNGLLHLVIKFGKLDHRFILNHTIKFDDVAKSVEGWTPEMTSQITGIPVEKLRQAANVLGNTTSLVCTTLQGAYQSVDATGSCVAINNLHLMRGLIGVPGSGPLHMAGQPSSSANRTVGGVGSYPGNRNPENPKHIEEMASLWNVSSEHLEVGPEKGIEEIVHLMEQGKVGVFWNICTNPMVSLPNRYRAKKAFENTFVVVQDPFLTETTEVADLVFPTAIWGEKEGTLENTDRTINLLTKAVDPPNDILSDFDILLEFAKRMGFKDKDGNPLISYQTPEECFEEWKIISKGRPSDMTGITYEKLKKYNGLRWPVNEEHPFGTERLYSDFKFHTTPDDAQSYGKVLLTGRARTKEDFERLKANGKAIMYATHFVPPAEQPNERFPFWLITGRLVWHWHSRTKTGRSPYLQMVAPQGYVEVNIEDAKGMRLIPGEVVKVSSPRGEIHLPVRIVDTLKSGVVFVPFHYGSWDSKQEANDLTVDFTDPLSKQPTFKQASCKIETIRRTYEISEQLPFQKIAEINNLTIDQLARLNRMMPPYRADVGEQVEVPLSMIDVKIPPYMPYRRTEKFPQFMQAKLPYTKNDGEREL